MEETQQTTSTEAKVEKAPRPALPRGRKIGRTIAIVLLVVAFVVAVAALLYGLATHPLFTSVLRDISIIVLALVTMVTGIFLAILVFQLQSLIALLRDEIYPILDSVNRTANTVRGTTTFVSDTVVSPVISAASYVSAIRQTLRLLFGSSSRSQKPHQGRTQEPTKPPDL
jgi:hypothetical protein